MSFTLIKFYVSRFLGDFLTNKIMTKSYSFWKNKGQRPVWIPPVEAKTIEVKKLTSTATIPTKNNETDAGYDLYADEDVVIYPEETVLISTGVSMAIPEGWAGFIWDRSGMGVKGVHRHAGVVDSSYRGEIKVALSNTLSHENWTKNVYFVKKGDRIAQIVIQEAPHFVLQEVDSLDETERGEKGFGSSGK